MLESGFRSDLGDVSAQACSSSPGRLASPPGPRPVPAGFMSRDSKARLNMGGDRSPVQRWSWRPGEGGRAALEGFDPMEDILLTSASSLFILFWNPWLTSSRPGQSAKIQLTRPGPCGSGPRQGGLALKPHQTLPWRRLLLDSVRLPVSHCSLPHSPVFKAASVSPLTNDTGDPTGPSIVRCFA